jgi:general secretion pathway protein G
MKPSRIQKFLSSPFTPKSTQAGMTIIEILIVIALMSTIMAVVVGQILDKNEQARIDLTGVRQSKLSESLTMYKLHTARFPSTRDGLQALVEAPATARSWKGPYTEPDKLDDLWGKPMQYELLNAKTFKITSAGSDGEFETEDDVVYPKDQAQAPERPTTVELTVPEGNLGKSER